MKNKYLIYKGSGGLGHMLQCIRRAIDYARTSKRKLIIDTKTHSGFGHDFSDFFKIKKLDYADHYDNIPTNLTWNGHGLEDVKKASKKYIPQGKYEILGIEINKIDLNSEEPIIVFTSCGHGKYPSRLKVSNSIKKKLEKEKPINGKYIGVHYRNTDMKHNIKPFLKKIKKITDKTNIKTIYLASDDYNSYDKFKKKFPHLNIIRKTVPPKNIKNLHYNESVDKFTQVYEALQDIYFILKANYFIGSPSSSFSHFIKHNIRLKKKNIFSFPSPAKIV